MFESCYTVWRLVTLFGLPRAMRINLSAIARDRLGAAVALAVIYFACAALTLQLTRFDGGVAIVWIAGAVLFARLCAEPRRRWTEATVVCVPAGVAASALFGFGHGVAVPLALVSIAEAWAAAWLLKRTCRRFGRFQSIAEVGRFLAIAGLLAPAASATAGAALAHFASGIGFASAWRDWYAGHALGNLVFAPPLLLALRGWRSGQRSPARPAEWREAALLFGAVVATSVITFGQNELPLVLLPLAAMMAATFRLGRFGAVTSIVILVSIGLGCTLLGRGPTLLLHGGAALRLQVLQLYFATVILILLPVAAELTARRRLVQRLRTAEAFHRLVLDRSGDVILRLAIDGGLRYASPALWRTTGFAPDAMIGGSGFAFVHEEDASCVHDARARAMASPDETASVEYRMKRADGGLFWVESHLRATLGEDGRVTGTVSVVREVSERRRLVEDLARQASADPLTGLANRRAFDRAMADRLAIGAQAGCVAIFDLDHFKLINDRLGHAVGDAVLVRFAAVLRSSVRDGDVVARIGGEEFAALLGGATTEQARLVCERIRLRLANGAEPLSSGEVVRVTVSAGVASLAGSTTADALAAADAALYRAKREGRNRLRLAA